MTYLHKLARRLARIPAAAGCIIFLLSCTQGEPQDYLGPDPSEKLISINVAPRDPQVPVGDSVRLSATGWYSTGRSAPVSATWYAEDGTVSPAGWFRPSRVGEFVVRALAAAQPGVMDSVRVRSFTLLGGIDRLEVLPHAVAVPRGTSQQFVARALLLDGSSVQPTVAWSATGGTITPGGLFTASATGGSVTIIASLGAGLASASEEVVIQPPLLTQLVLNPSAMFMEAGESRLLNVAASWSDGGTALPPLVWSVQGGSLDGQTYTAGSTPGTYPIIVRAPNYARADTALVWVLPRVIGLRAEPSHVALAPGAVVPLSAVALRNDGSESPAGVEWSVTGGTITADGNYTAGAQAGQFRAVATLRALGGGTFTDTVRIGIATGAATLTGISVTPEVANTLTGDAVQFGVAGTWSDGSSAVPAVTWSASGGAIDGSGRYVAGNASGTFEIIAQAQGGGGSLADTARVTVGPKLEAFRIAPKVDTMSSGATRQFSATLSWSDGQAHPYTTSWSTTGGAISSTGVYSPGALVGSFLVVAMCSCGASDTAAVNVLGAAPPASPTLMTLVISPASVALAMGAIQQFSVAGTWSNGETGPVGVLYEVSAGSISAAGVYQAPNIPGTHRVIAVQQGGERRDTAFVTVEAEATTLNQLELNPAAVTLEPGGRQTFSVSGVWSDGSQTAPAVIYSATGGTMSDDGVFTAGSATGTFKVIALQQGGTLADTSLVTIPDPSGPTLTQLVLNPSASTVTPGGTQQFQVGALWSDGSTTLPPLSWSTSCGSVSGGGLYSAAAAPGSCQVIVRHQGGTRADTSTVTIPALTSLSLTPATASVAPGGTQLFAVAGTWSSGSLPAPDVTYSATGGTISPAGLYTAGGTAGTYVVIARHTAGTLADTSSVTVTGSAPPPPPPPTGGSNPELPRVYLDTDYNASGPVTNVPAGANLQTYLNAASPGDQIVLPMGATFTGNFTLPAKANCVTGGWIVVRGAVLPPEGVRVSPATAAGFPKLVTPTVAPAILAKNGSCGWRIVGVEIMSTPTSPTVNYNYALVRLGEGETSLATLPHDIIFDRVYIHGSSNTAVKNGLELNGARQALIDSHVGDIRWLGTESHAVVGWAGNGPFKIVNNYLEAASINILFGGADPSIANLSPSDIEIRRNHITKRLSWRGAGFAVKNLIEFKHAQRVLVEANVLERSWSDGQTGMAVNIKSAGQAAWTQTTDVTFRYNLIRDVNEVATLTPHGDGGTGIPPARLVFEHNLCERIGGDQTYRGFLVSGALRDVRLERNTVVMNSASQGTPLGVEGSNAQGFTFANNIISPSGIYGPVFRSGTGTGLPALNAFAGSGWIFSGNVFGNQNQQVGAALLPPGNVYLPGPVTVNPDGSVPSYPGRGADITVLLPAISGVAP
jgi:hypothetical protein